MNIKKSLESIGLLSTICCLLLAAGCQTAGFAKPDLSSLAFWKRERQTVSVPPPPARHFDPARIQSEAKSQLADNETGKKPEMPGAPGKPIRSPYTIEEDGAGQLANDNQFNLNADQIESYERSNRSAESSQLNGAQVDFQAAMNQSLDTVNQLGHQTEIGLRQTLNESQDRMAATTAEVVDDSAAAINQQTKGLKANLDNGFERFSAKVGTVRDSVQEKLAGVSESTRDALHLPFPSLKPSPSSAAETAVPEDPALGQMQSELETTRRNMERLRQQLAESKQIALESEAISTPRARPEPNFDRELSREPVPPPAGFAGAANSGFAPPSTTPLTTQPPTLQPVPQSTPTDYASKNGFPKTQFKGFGSDVDSAQPPMKASGGAFDAGGAFAGAAQQTSKENPPAFVGGSDSGFQPPPSSVASQPQPSPERVAELGIPEAILVGKGTYAPGSVNRLIQR